MLTIDRIRFLLDSYESGRCTKSETLDILYDDVFQEIIAATGDGNEFMVARSVCYGSFSPDNIKLEIDYHPSCMTARRAK